MSHCIENNPHTIGYSTIEEENDVDYYVKLPTASATITVIITGGKVVSVSPSGPRHDDDWIEFTNAHLDTVYTVGVDPVSARALTEEPTKNPKFKPQTTCPSW